MGNGLISGLLGGAKGFGDAMTVMADDRRKQLAERLKMELEEKMRIDAEGRGVENQKGLLKFANEELGMSKSTREGAELEDKLATGRISLENELAIKRAEAEAGRPLSAAEKEKINAEHSNRMAELEAEGQIRKDVAGLSFNKADLEADREERLQRSNQLKVKLKNTYNIDATVAEDGSLFSETPIPDEKSGEVSKLASEYGIDLAFNKSEEGGFLGFGSKPVSRITGSAFSGGGIISGKVANEDKTVEDKVTTDTKGQLDIDSEWGGKDDEKLDAIIKKATGKDVPVEQEQKGPVKETTQKQQGVNTDKIGASGSLFGYRGAQPEKLPTTVEGWNELASQVGVGSENWKALGKLAKTIGGTVWEAYRKVIDKTGMFSVEGQKKAMKESGVYK